MPRTTLNINAKDNASRKIRSVTKSMISANLILAAGRKAWDLMKKAVTGSIKAYIKQEQAEAQLNAVLKSTQHAAGMTAKELKAMAASLQSVTTFGDEAIIKTQSLLLTFTKVGKDVFPAATETILNMSAALGQSLNSSAIQVGKALNDPIKGITALRRVGVQLSEAQEEQIRKFVEMGDVASAQKVILGELETQFGGTAQAMRKTFGGAIQAFKNVSGDLSEQYGKMAKLIGTDIVNALTDATQAQVEYFKSAAGQERMVNFIAKVKAGFMALKNIMQPFIESFRNAFLEIKKATERFGELSSGGQKSGIVMKILTQAMKIAAFSMGLMAKTTATVIGVIVDLVKIIRRAGKVISAAFSGDFRTASQEVQNLGDDFKNLTANTKNNVNRMVADVKNFKSEMSKGMSADEIKKQYYTDFNEIKETTKKSMEETTEVVKDEIKKQGDAVTDGTGDAAKKSKATWEDYVLSLRNLFGSLVDYFNQQLDLQIASIEAGEKKKIAIVNSSENAQLTALKRKFYDGLISKAEYENESTRIQKTAEKKRVDAEKQTAMDVYKVQLKQFEANKKVALANAVVDTASAVVKTLASVPFPASLILAALAGAAGGVQIATISSQQPPAPPSFSSGGVMPYSGTAMVGERGRELVQLPAGSQVLDNATTERVLPGQGLVIHNLVVQANNPVEMQRKLMKQVSRYERGMA